MGVLDPFLNSIRRSKASPMKPAGTSGTAIYGGFVISGETSSKLQGTERYKTYSELLANVSIIAAGTRAFQQLVSKAGWKFEPAEESGTEGEDLAKLVEEIFYDMASPWPRIVKRASLYRFYGFGVQEWTAKKRDDGVIGMLDIAARPQRTIEQWDVDDTGRVVGIIQRSPQTMTQLYLPRSKVIYCVDDSLSDSPEGLGLLRHVVDAASRLRRFEQLEGFGYETDLRGIPVGRGPFAALQQAVADGKLTAAQKATIELPMRQFIEGHVKNPQLGILLDSITYQSADEANTPSAIPLWSIELMTGSSQSHEFVANAIERLNREIARVLGVEQLLLGEKGAGSLALSRDKSNQMAMLVDSTLNDLCFQFKTDLLEPLFKLNGWDTALMPTLKTESIQYRDVEQVTSALAQMATAGAVLPPDDPAINEVRDMLGLSKQPQEIIDVALQQKADEAKAALMPPGGLDPNGDPNTPPEKGKPDPKKKD